MYKLSNYLLFCAFNLFSGSSKKETVGLHESLAWAERGGDG